MTKNKHEDRIPITALLGFALLLGGCGDLIKVTPPSEIQKVYETGPSMTLNEAKELQPRVDADFARARAVFIDRINEAAFWDELGRSFVNTGINIAGHELSAIPFGGISLTLLGSVLGTVGLSKPSDKKKIKDLNQAVLDAHAETVRIRKESEDKGYDMGREEAVRTIREGSA